MRMGIAGYGCDTGLGIATRTFFEQLPFERWLLVRHREFGTGSLPEQRLCTVFERDTPVTTLDEWLAGLDILFCIERQYIPGLWECAWQRGVRVILMPNIEYFVPTAYDLRFVDQFVAPTQVAERFLRDHGFGAHTTYIPHPIALDRFIFRQRERARTFAHYRGHGGHGERKGTPLVLAAARLCPSVQFAIHYQTPITVDCPGNVALVGPTTTPEAQYQSADIAIQPSLWEGVGLQILEAMASGIPTIVPDAPPMNEYVRNTRLLVPASSRVVEVNWRDWTAWYSDVDALADTIRTLHNQSISALSSEARSAVAERDWKTYVPRLLALLTAQKHA